MPMYGITTERTGAISCILDGNNVVRNATDGVAADAATGAGDPQAYGISAVHLYR